MPDKLMSQRDRTNLQRIVNNRFKLIEQQMQHRENELRARIQEEIRSESQVALNKAQAKVAKLSEKAQKLEAEAAEIQKELRAQGIVVYNEARYQNPSYALLSVDIADEKLQPANFNQRVEERIQQLKEEHGYAKLDLEQSKLQLTEELLIGAIGSDDAKAFLEKVPSVDKLLPLPERKALNA